MMNVLFGSGHELSASQRIGELANAKNVVSVESDEKLAMKLCG